MSDTTPPKQYDKDSSVQQPATQPVEAGMNPTPHKHFSLPLAILMTLGVVVCIREVALLVCSHLGYASAANIVGMITLFVLLILCRYTIGIPKWITEGSNHLLLDSGFAFLPVSAGAGLLIFALGGGLLGIMLVITISTLLPLWGLAMLSNSWLSSHRKATGKDIK